MKRKDPWRIKNMKCGTCLWYKEKKNGIGRCRRHAPTLNGFPVVFEDDLGCGDHKLSEDTI